MMTRVLFVCSGNTCRSAMAQYILEELAARRGLSGRLTVCSAGLNACYGEPMTDAAARALDEHKVPRREHRARLLTDADCAAADLAVVMTEEQLSRVAALCGPEHPEKAVCLLDFTGEQGDIADPYGGDAAEYERAYCQLARGCTALLDARFGAESAPLTTS